MFFICLLYKRACHFNISHLAANYQLILVRILIFKYINYIVSSEQFDYVRLQHSAECLSMTYWGCLSFIYLFCGSCKNVTICYQLSVSSRVFHWQCAKFVCSFMHWPISSHVSKASADSDAVSEWLRRLFVLSLASQGPISR